MAHARLAEAYLELDLTDKAREEMLRAAPPGSSPLLSRAERSYLQALQLTLTGRFADAAGLYRDLLAHAPAEEKGNAYLDLGRAYEKNEKIKEATEAYLQATRRQSQNPAAWLRLAILYGRQMQQDRASQAFQRAEQLYRSLSNLEGSIEVLYQQAVLANRMGNLGEARTLLGQALELSTHTGSVSQQIQALQQLADIEYSASEFAQAQSDAAKAIEMARANGLENLTARGLVDLGNAYFLKGDADEARKAYTQSLEYARRFHSERNEARALFSLGSLAMRYGDLDEAIRNVQQALVWYQRGGYQRETANALVLLARAQRRKGDFDAALGSFDRQLRLGNQMGDPSLVALAQQGRGTVLQAQGRLPEALAADHDAYEAAHRTADQLSSAYDLLNSAQVYWRLGRYREARESLGLAGPSPSRDVAALDDLTRGEMALSQRDFRNAVERSQRVLDQPNLSIELTVAAKRTLGAAQMAAGERGKGLATLAEAAQLAGKSGSALLFADTRLAYADALLQAGQPQRARDTALAAQQWFAAAGNREAEWRSWLVAAGAESALGHAAIAQSNAQKASQLLASLEQKWDAENYKTYLGRPDIQDRGKQLAKLAGTR
jgi:tetratricopeptide (TPR) repeat protein